MIDLGASRNEADFVSKMLKRFGLPTDIGACIAALAGTIRDHKHFERLLTEAPPADRQDLYDALIPHLQFTPKPLDVYVANAGQRAEREQWPVLGPDGMLMPFKPAADVSSLEKDVQEMIAAAMAQRRLMLTCSKCLREETFHAVGEETRVAVVIRARKKGWVYDYASNPPREICPKCPTSMRQTPIDLPQPTDL
jgi:hypothetical protein